MVTDKVMSRATDRLREALEPTARNLTALAVTAIIISVVAIVISVSRNA